MHQVAYDDVVKGVLMRLGWPTDQLTGAQAEVAKVAINRAIKDCWDSYWWSVLMVTERRRLRDEWQDDETYSAGDEVYHPESDAYYVALKAILDFVEPAAFDTDENEWVTNNEAWAKQFPSEKTPPDVNGDSWDSDTDYEVGDRVIWNGDIYQCWSAAAAGIQPDNISFWGQVPAFNYVMPLTMLGYRAIGRVRAVQNCDPAVSPHDTEVEFEEQADGVRIFNLCTPRPWVTYRIRCPILNGSTFDEEATYSQETLDRAVFGLPGPNGVRLLGTEGGDYLTTEGYTPILVL